MTTSDVERELTAALQRRAEDAMSRTDTDKEMRDFVDRVEGQHRRRRPLLAVSAAATALVAIGSAVYLAHDDSADTGPVDDSRSVQTPDERVADEFAQVLTAGESEKIKMLLTHRPDGSSDWRTQLQRDQAWSVRYVLDHCTEVGGSDYGTNVVCPFDYYALGSDALGMAPFGNNNISLVVRNGTIRSFQTSYSDTANGNSDLYEAFAKWDLARHPGEWPFLRSLEPSDGSRWVRLWQRRTAEYVAAQQG